MAVKLLQAKVETCVDKLLKVNFKFIISVIIKGTREGVQGLHELLKMGSKPPYSQLLFKKPDASP